MEKIEWTVIPDGGYRYLTINECFRQNANRHLQRANRYLFDDNIFDYAEGSLKKAEKNYKNAHLFKIDDPFVKFIVNDLAEQIATTIIVGK